MPIVYYGRSESKKMAPQTFSDLSELRELLALHPDLLQADDEPPVVVVQRNVHLGGAVAIDFLLADDDGRLIVAEVRAAGNHETSRQIFARVFDFISTLGGMTVETLDHSLGGALETALRSFLPDPDDEYGFESLWRSCETHLRAGQIRLVVAADSASDELVNAITFINEHSDLDVRLVAVKKFSNDEGETILVPSVAVLGKASAPVRRLNAPQNPRPEFEAVIAAYTKIAIEGFEPRGAAARYRMLRPEWWPRGIHYEFFDYGGEIGVEVHLESAEVQPLADLLRSFAGEFAAIFPSAIVNWDSNWSRGRGRLRVLVSPGAAPLEVVGAMKVLVKQTWGPINQGLEALRLTPHSEPGGLEPVRPLGEEARPFQKTITIGNQNIIIEERKLRPGLPLADPAAIAESVPGGPSGTVEAVEPRPAEPARETVAPLRPEPVEPVSAQTVPERMAAEFPKPGGMAEAPKPSVMAGFIEVIDENGRSSLINPLKMGVTRNLPEVEVFRKEAGAGQPDASLRPLEPPGKSETAPERPDPAATRLSELLGVEPPKPAKPLPRFVEVSETAAEKESPEKTARRSSKQLEELLNKLDMI